MPAITLTITPNEDRSINVSGPIDDKILSYGMLDCAKDAIRDHIANSQKRVIAPLPGVPPIPIKI